MRSRRSRRRSLVTLLARLDAYGSDDPDFNEGQPEDRCPVCEWPVVDHRRWPPRRGQVVAWRAKWPHRWHALLDMAIRRWP